MERCVPAIPVTCRVITCSYINTQEHTEYTYLYYAYWQNSVVVLIYTFPMLCGFMSVGLRQINCILYVLRLQHTRACMVYTFPGNLHHIVIL